jgi:hypothetical protein
MARYRNNKWCSASVCHNAMASFGRSDQRVGRCSTGMLVQSLAFGSGRVVSGAVDTLPVCQRLQSTGRLSAEVQRETQATTLPLARVASRCTRHGAQQLPHAAVRSPVLAE